DIASLHIPPRRPPREEVGVARIERAVHIDEPVAQDGLYARALVGALANDAWLALLGVDVHVGARHVHVAAQNERLAFLLELGGVAGPRLAEADVALQG